MHGEAPIVCFVNSLCGFNVGEFEGGSSFKTHTTDPWEECGIKNTDP